MSLLEIWTKISDKTVLVGNSDHFLTEYRQKEKKQILATIFREFNTKKNMIRNLKESSYEVPT
ncbi:hypothetical protein Hdeb2414_s0004g00150711 [Helianthus debilis subsp. tardiflorus]